LYDFASDHPLDLNELRARLRVSDEALKQFGAAARYMCSPSANAKKPPREVFVVQLRGSDRRVARASRDKSKG